MFHSDLNHSGVGTGNSPVANTSLWNFTADGKIRSSPAVVGGVVYVSCIDGNVYALDAATGRKKWSCMTESSVFSSPAVYGGLVYVGDDDGNVYGLDAATGTEQWSYQTGSVFVDSSPAVANSVVYVGCSDGYLFALNANNGAKLWSHSTNTVYSSPAVVNGVVYTGNELAAYALDATNGAEIWSHKTGIPGDSSPAVANGIVYVADQQTLYALKASNGNEVWHYGIKEFASGPLSSSPAVANGVVYKGCGDGYVYALDAAKGTLLWKADAQGTVVSSPAVCGGVVYVGSFAQPGSGLLCALDATTGKQLWTHKLGGNVYSSPAVINGVLYIGCDDHKLYAFGGAAPPPTINVYPAEPNYTRIQLDYKSYGLSSWIALQTVHDAAYPSPLVVSFDVTGGNLYLEDYCSFMAFASGSTSVSVKLALNCVKGDAQKLPMNYNVSITADSGAYHQVFTISLRLLKAKWLVMQYSAADTGTGKGAAGDLEECMAYNLHEMAKVCKSNDNPAVGMFALFDAGWAMTFPDAAPGTTQQAANTIKLYQVSQGTIKQVGSDWPETATNRPAVLRKFIDTVMTLEPADRNQLILSDHGGGIEGYAWDFHDGNSPMSIPDLATALNGVSPKLDIISFDACMMAQVEVLYQLRNYAAYFTASEPPIPGGGYDYTGFLKSLLTNPDQPTLDYLKVIVSTYGAKRAADLTNMNPTMLAAIDSSKLEGVVSGLNNFAGLLVAKYKSAAESPSFNATMLKVMGKCNYVKEKPYVDITSLAENILLSPLTSDPKVGDAATALIKATKTAVVANVTRYVVNSKPVPITYGGLTVAFWWNPNIPEIAYQYLASLEVRLTFPTAATNWLPLMQCFNNSLSQKTAHWLAMLLVHPGHQLFLSVYDSTGGHTGINPALLNESYTELELIPGSIYLDLDNHTTLIALPGSQGSFRTVVDGSSMIETSEPYTLKYTVVKNGTVTSTKTVQGTISQYTLQSANATVQNGIITVGATSTSTPIPEFGNEALVLALLALGIITALVVMRARKRFPYGTCVLARSLTFIGAVDFQNP